MELHQRSQARTFYMPASNVAMSSTNIAATSTRLETHRVCTINKRKIHCRSTPSREWLKLYIDLAGSAAYTPSSCHADLLLVESTKCNVHHHLISLALAETD